VHGLKVSIPNLLILMLAVASSLKGGEAGKLDYEFPTLLRGTIYSKDHKAVLFEFERRSTVHDRYVEAVREYNYPSGKIAAREIVTYDGNRLAGFVLKDFQTGATGSVQVLPERGRNSDVLHFEYAEKAGTKPKQTDEPWRPDALVTDMIPRFLVSHWDRLMGGEEIKCRLVVVPRRETVGFTFRKVSSASTKQGKVTIKMFATSAIIAALVDPVYFVMEKEPPHHILEYSGRTTPKLKKGNSWKDLEAVTVFDWEHSKP
jgi:hypothetical protein